MKVKILHMYYDIMNLYGDFGNVSVLTNHLEEQGAEVIVDRKSIGDEIYFNDYDFIYIGSGTEKNLDYVMKDAMKYKNALKEYMDSDGIALFTGNSFEMFGECIDDEYALNLFDYEVKRLKDRETSNVIYKIRKSDIEVVGFINKMTIMYHNMNPLFEVVYGKGENEQNDYEGIKYKNTYGTHVTGPVLVRNVQFLEMFVKLICEKKGIAYIEKSYDNMEKGHEIILNEIKVRANNVK